MATPIHNHSHYSALDGASKPEEIADAVFDNGMLAAAITDHGVVSGHLEFHKVMTARNLQPILGMEAYQAPISRYVKENPALHLVLIAKNSQGLRNLWALSTEANATGFYYKPRVDWDVLEKYKEGLICTSACLGGMLSQSIMGPPEKANEAMIKTYQEMGSPEQVLRGFQNIFKDDFYIELHTYTTELQGTVNMALLDLARQYSVPVVYANDAHYAFKSQWDLHEDVILRLTQNSGRKAAEGEGRDRVHPQCLYIMTEPEVRDALADHGLPKSVIDESITNSDAIAEQIWYDMPESRKRTPIFLPDTGYKTNKEMFLGLLERAFQKKVVDWQGNYPRDRAVYFDRLQKEIKVMFDADLVDYFLIVQDYVNYARKKGVKVGPGRGSAGGSLVSFLLGITDVDPIYYGLQFERFYNAGREKGLPDIDVDFDTKGRALVVEYVSRKYGADKVSFIGTVTRMGPKLAIADASRVLPEAGIEAPNYMEKKRISEILDTTVESGLWDNWADILEKVREDLQPYIDKYPKLFEYAEQLMGRKEGDRHTGYIKTYGVHASAVIVADEPLAENFPLRWVASDERLVTQWDMHDAEHLGYMKMDFLGLTQLSIFAALDEVLAENNRPAINWDSLQYQEHPVEMWELLDKGLTTGVFQMDASGTAKKLCKEIKPRSVEDLGMIVAINRPGPLIAGSDKRIIAARQGEQVVYLNDIVRRVTEDTYGEFIYQEQITALLTEIGYTLSEADTVRKSMGKKIRSVMEKEYARFMEHAEQHMPKDQAQAIWDIIEPFAKYAFNKSHSIQYGVISLHSLYCKFHFPPEYIAAGIRADDKSKRSKWINEALLMAIPVVAPDINVAAAQVSAKDGHVLLGLADIKNIGKGHAKWIVENRPYASYDEFVEKTREDDRKQTLPSGVRKIAVDIGRCGKLWEAGCFDSLEPRTLSRSDRIALEEELLGVALSDDSEAVVMKSGFLDRVAPISEAVKAGTWTLAGVIRNVTHSKTKKGDPMARATLVYENDEITFAIWKENLMKYDQHLTPRTPVIVKVKGKNDPIRGLQFYLEDLAALR